MNLISIYERPDRALVLHQLLEERDDTANISHKVMPSWDEHVRFVESKPYQAWYFIEDNGTIGACYLSKQDEIGVFIFKAYQGKHYGTWAIEALMLKHGKRRYLANVSPRNERSLEVFRNLGFKPIQITHERI
jgi:RimJ/RimL family protein N-acetyltransferase